MKTTYNFLNKLSLQILTLTLFSSTIAYGFATQTPGKAEPVWGGIENSSNDPVIDPWHCIIGTASCNPMKKISPETTVDTIRAALVLLYAQRSDDPELKAGYTIFINKIKALDPKAPDLDAKVKEVVAEGLNGIDYDLDEGSITTSKGKYKIKANPAATGLDDAFTLTKIQ
jgi:hypothetical protein